MTPGDEQEITVEPKVFGADDLEELERDTQGGGQYLRVKNDPVHVVLQKGEILATENKFKRPEFRMIVKRAEEIEKYGAAAKEYIFAMSKRGMGSVVKAIRSSGVKLAPGLSLKVARVGSGFDTTFAVEIVKPPAANGAG